MLHSKLVEKTNGNGSQEPQALRFGVFDLDLRAGELRRNGVRVKLQDQPFQILAQLLEKPGDVVTREELRERLWPADTFVDFDHSLNAAVRRLRDALGDSAENPVFVETVARRGYRFLAPVTVKTNNGNSAELPAVEPQPAVASASHRIRRWLAGIAAAIILVYLGMKIGLICAAIRATPPVRLTQLTANPEDDRVRAAAISPDGRYLAYSDETGFYLRQIDTGETHRIALPNMMRSRSISWFPDNAHMVVGLTAVGYETSLWEISALGGNAHKLNDAGWSPSVSPDGKEIAFIGGTHFSQQVWVMESDGTQSHKVAGEKGDLFGSAAWSPDSTKLAYTHGRGEYEPGGGDIQVLDVGSQHTDDNPALLTKNQITGLQSPLAWTADDRMVYVLDEPPPRAQDSNLWSIPVDAQGKRLGAPARLTGDAGEVFSISATSDGKRLGYLKGAPQPDVYVAELQRAGNITEPQRLTLDDHKDIPYDWTVDGKEVIFTSDRAGALNIYKQAVDQTVPELLVRDSHPLVESRLSPDGSQILYVQYPQWGENAPTIPLMRAPLAGGVPQKVLEDSLINNHQCARAPATVCIYSVVKDRTLTFLTFDPFRGKGTQILQIEEDLPQSYAWSLSPDGRMLALVRGKVDAPARIRLVSLDAQAHVSGGRWLIVEGWSLASLDWAADSKSLWTVSLDDEENALLNVDMDGRARVVWRPKDKAVWWAIPSRDNRWLALHVESTSANAWMIERP